MARAPALFTALLVLAAAAPALAATYTPPRETAALPPGPGADKARLYCLVCHSADYVTTQPPGMPGAFWEASVVKMVRVYGAPIPETETKALAAYLTAITAAPPKAPVR
ncbi:MAG TPA: cytochrome c [Caulobacteraceae bacterium]|jgi:hypothetical protein|nr:cytochrome c [Caulobacteraceae bacterium]